MRGQPEGRKHVDDGQCSFPRGRRGYPERGEARSEEHTSELQSQSNLVCRLLLEKKKKQTFIESLPRQPRPNRCRDRYSAQRILSLSDKTTDLILRCDAASNHGLRSLYEPHSDAV